MARGSCRTLFAQHRVVSDRNNTVAHPAQAIPSARRSHSPAARPARTSTDPNQFLSRPPSKWATATATTPPAFSA
ncbi:hypothetical protein BST61_g10842 [Cercospora zeina]